MAVCVRFAFGATTRGRSGGADFTHENPLKQRRMKPGANESAFCAPSNRATGLKSSAIPKLLQMFRFPKSGRKEIIPGASFCSQRRNKFLLAVKDYGRG